MKKVLFWCLVPFAVLLALIHYLGLVFAASIGVAVLLWLLLDAPAAASYLSVAWKIYVALGIFNFAFLTTFTYQHCCVGLQSFRSHLRHRGWAKVVEHIAASFVWPWCWFALSHNLRRWYISLPVAMFDAVAYWLVDYWRGTPVTFMDFETGETTTVYAKTAEEAMQVVDEALSKKTQKN